MATALGSRILVRYAQGDCTADQLAAAHVRGWITNDEYAAASEN